MKYLHRAFKEDLENTTEFCNGQFSICGSQFPLCEVLTATGRFEETFQSWLLDWQERMRDKACDILDEYDQHDRFAKIVKAHKERTLTPFVGAGLSMPSGYPSWVSFLHKLRSESALSEANLNELLDNYEYEEAAEQLFTSLGEARFNEILENTFSKDVEIQGVVGHLPYIFSGALITLNYDKLLERAYKNLDKPFDADNVILGSDSEQIRRFATSSQPYLLKLHGKAMNPCGRILTKTEYDSHYTETSPLSGTVRVLYDRYNLLFLGCSLGNDRFMRVCAEHVATIGHNNLNKHYTFLAAPEDSSDMHSRREELAKYNIFPIWYPQGTHDESITALLTKLHEDAQG